METEGWRAGSTVRGVVVVECTPLGRLRMGGEEIYLHRLPRCYWKVRWARVVGSGWRDVPVAGALGATLLPSKNIPQRRNSQPSQAEGSGDFL